MITFWIIYILAGIITFLVEFFLGEIILVATIKAILWPLHWIIVFIRRGGGL